MEYAGKLDQADRLLLDGSITAKLDDLEFHKIDAEKNYSTTQDALERLADYCEGCGGFSVLYVGTFMQQTA